MGCHVRSRVARLLLVIIVTTLMPVPPCAAAAPGKAEPVPVVLVHGMRGSPESSWGAPAKAGDSPTGMYLALCRAGYTPGRTLFVCDYHADNLGDYRELALTYLPAAIDQARAASGAKRVDLIARSMGGLVARSYVCSAAYRGDVRTLVMIATPNRGSFGANIVRAMEMINLQEQLRDRGALRARPLAQPVLPPAADLFPAFTDEVGYVHAQSTRLWEPLFAAYYSGSWLLADRAGGGRSVAAGLPVLAKDQPSVGLSGGGFRAAASGEPWVPVGWRVLGRRSRARAKPHAGIL